MSIQYAGGTNVHANLTGSSIANLVDDIKVQLLAAGWTATAATGGWKMDSVATAHGLRLRCYVRDDSGFKMKFSPVDESVFSQDHILNIVASRTYKIIANKYQFFIYLPSVTLGDGGSIANFVGAGVPYLPEQVQPTAVTGATNATPIVITAVAHGLTTGEQVYIQGVGGNTAANGLWTVTVLTADTFSLNTSVGNGAYTSGGFVGGPRKISRCMWAMSNPNTVSGSWRVDLRNVSGQDDPYFVVINESSWAASVAGSGNTALPMIPMLCMVTGAGTLNQLLWHGSRYVLSEPLLRMGRGSSTDGQIVGQLWDAAIINRGFTVDLEDTFDSHTWHRIGGASPSDINPSLWVVIP